MSDWKQEALEAGELGGTPSEVRALEMAYSAGYKAGIVAAAECAARQACVNDMHWPRNIAHDIIGLLREARREDT